uniref:Protein arginine N-methyltransferase domain-containing protein n=1 Tax=Cajanus cajan TaxID=3821 RepID=A0A151SJI3_CAJCA|nr:putative protein arginine N-methyltransferase 4.2 [Cajanus cajan]
MGTSANTVGGGRSAAVPKDVDYAQYFCTYAFLYHQKEMLSDRVRMDAYFNAIFENKRHFAGKKTVLDVGTGSGILAIWSAQAGARKVYAVEATKMSEHARALVKANNLQDIVEVIEGSMEDVTLPEKVDVIISEWMGYFLLRESMFDSVIHARDHWLKPTGVMYPSHARMWMAPIKTGIGDHKFGDYESTMDDWHNFVDETKAYYGVDMSTLTKPFAEEQRKYYLQANGRSEDLAENMIELTTAPSVDYGTHWGQQVFLLHPPMHLSEGDDIKVSFLMSRSKENHRLMEVELGCEIHQHSGKLLAPFKSKYFIE